jgi:hypothetical protein
MPVSPRRCPASPEPTPPWKIQFKSLKERAKIHSHYRQAFLNQKTSEKFRTQKIDYIDICLQQVLEVQGKGKF